MFNRHGLIIDVRSNRGGNLDAWILEKLLRKAWFYWQPRVGEPYWNMHYAFRGHVTVLCNERTASDGEAFSEGFNRLGLGKVDTAVTEGTQRKFACICHSGIEAQTYVYDLSQQHRRAVAAYFDDILAGK